MSLNSWSGYWTNKNRRLLNWREETMQIVSAHMRKNNSFLRRLKIVFPILIGLLLVFAAPCWCQSHGNRNNQQRTYERHNIHAGMAGLQHKTSLINRHLATNHHMVLISKGPLSAQLYAGMVGSAEQNRSESSADRNQSSYGNNQRLRNNEKKWENLTPQKQDELRNRMDRYKNLPPEDRKLYQKRYQQLQQLPPDERHDIQNKLRRMDRLSPEEKEEIRKKFE